MATTAVAVPKAVCAPGLDWQRLALGQGPREANGRRYPAYTDSSLARAIQQGIDPAGNRLDPAMPRFELTLADQRNLTAYLKRLADERDPGVEEGVLRLARCCPRAVRWPKPGRWCVPCWKTAWVNSTSKAAFTGGAWNWSY